MPNFTVKTIAISITSLMFLSACGGSSDKDNNTTGTPANEKTNIASNEAVKTKKVIIEDTKTKDTKPEKVTKEYEQPTYVQTSGNYQYTYDILTSGNQPLEKLIVSNKNNNELVVVPQNDTAELAGLTVTVPKNEAVNVGAIQVVAQGNKTIPTDDAKSLSSAFKLTPSGTQFAKPVLVTMPYNLDGIDSKDELFVLRKSEDGTIDYIVPEFIDKNAGTVGFKTSHFTEFELKRKFFNKLQYTEEVSKVLRDVAQITAKHHDNFKFRDYTRIKEVLNTKVNGTDKTVYDLYLEYDLIYEADQLLKKGLAEDAVRLFGHKVSSAQDTWKVIEKGINTVSTAVAISQGGIYLANEITSKLGFPNWVNIELYNPVKLGSKAIKNLDFATQNINNKYYFTIEENVRKNDGYLKLTPEQVVEESGIGSNNKFEVEKQKSLYKVYEKLAVRRYYFNKSDPEEGLANLFYQVNQKIEEKNRLKKEKAQFDRDRRNPSFDFIHTYIGSNRLISNEEVDFKISVNSRGIYDDERVMVQVLMDGNQITEFNTTIGKLENSESFTFKVPNVNDRLLKKIEFRVVGSFKDSTGRERQLSERSFEKIEILPAKGKLANHDLTFKSLSLEKINNVENVCFNFYSEFTGVSGNVYFPAYKSDLTGKSVNKKYCTTESSFKDFNYRYTPIEVTVTEEGYTGKTYFKHELNLRDLYNKNYKSVKGFYKNSINITQKISGKSCSASVGTSHTFLKNKILCVYLNTRKLNRITGVNSAEATSLNIYGQRISVSKPIETDKFGAYYLVRANKIVNNFVPQARMQLSNGKTTSLMGSTISIIDNKSDKVDPNNTSRLPAIVIGSNSPVRNKPFKVTLGGNKSNVAKAVVSVRGDNSQMWVLTGNNLSRPVSITGNTEFIVIKVDFYNTRNRKIGTSYKRVDLKENDSLDKSKVPEIKFSSQLIMNKPFKYKVGLGDKSKFSHITVAFAPTNGFKKIVPSEYSRLHTYTSSAKKLSVTVNYYDYSNKLVDTKNYTLNFKLGATQSQQGSTQGTPASCTKANAHLCQQT